VIYSFIGSEIVAVTAGEAKDPEKSVPHAMRTMLLRLAIFYIGAISVLVGVIPWNQIQPGRNITVSPFVRVFDMMHIPAATHVINFVVLTAALSSMNCNLYMATRMIFSLSRAGYAPQVFGRVSQNGTPLAALLFSAGGHAASTLFAIWFPGSAYVYLFGISLFGGLFVWMMVFVTHLRFRKYWQVGGNRALPIRMKLFPFSTILGGACRARNPAVDLVGRRYAGCVANWNPVAADADTRVLYVGTPAGTCGTAAHRRGRGGKSHAFD